MPEDPSELVSLDTSRVPLLVTLTKIGPNYVVDATEKEEAASVSSFVLAVDPDGQILHSRKIGSGSLFVPPLRANWSVSRDLRAKSRGTCYSFPGTCSLRGNWD